MKRRPQPARAIRPPRAAAASRARILAAASGEFAARGFDGAKVDRIAARAKLNKAMLYYHFKSKAALYREILLDMFETVSAAVRDAVDPGAAADRQLAAYIGAIARAAESRPHFPPIWLREIAEGGRHVDETIVTRMRSVIETVGGILQRGRAAGQFRPANPFITQIGIVAPMHVPRGQPSGARSIPRQAARRHRQRHARRHGGARERRHARRTQCRAVRIRRLQEDPVRAQRPSPAPRVC